MKQNAMKVALILSLAMALALFLGACSGDQETGDQQTSDRQAAQIEIKAPSSGETTIAPGRHFKVSGSLSGEIPDDAVLKVTLLDEAGQEVRYAATDQIPDDRRTGAGK